MNDKIVLLKKQFPEGTSIELYHMEGEPHMPKGLKGIITHVDDFEQIHVNWENGSHLALNLDVDSFKLIELHVIENYRLLKIGSLPVTLDKTTIIVNHIVVLDSFDYQFFKGNIIRNHLFIKKLNSYFKKHKMNYPPFIVTHDFKTGIVIHTRGCDYAKRYCYIENLSDYKIEENV